MELPRLVYNISVPIFFLYIAVLENNRVDECIPRCSANSRGSVFEDSDRLTVTEDSIQYHYKHVPLKIDSRIYNYIKGLGK